MPKRMEDLEKELKEHWKRTETERKLTHTSVLYERINAISKDKKARMSIPISGLTEEQINQVKEWKRKIEAA